MKSELGAVDRLILDEAGSLAGRICVIDAPAIANELAAKTGKVSGYCDDFIAESRCATPVLESLDQVVATQPKLVLMRLPKSLAQLEEYTQFLSRIPKVRVVAGGRVKHMTPTMNEVLATGFSRVFASLGRQKSRVLHAQDGHGPAKTVWPKTAHHEALDLNVVVYGGTFSGTKLDRGTRLLLSAMDGLPDWAATGCAAIDLGCGSGLIAAHLARNGATVIGVDVSRAATHSARETAQKNGLADRVQIIRNNGLRGFKAKSTDLVACNPPFHVGTTKDSKPAEEMFRGAATVLRNGGEMWTVFNSHLPYRDMLKHLIGPTKVVAQDPNYTVTRSIRRR